MNTLHLGSDEIPATKKKSNTRNLKIALGLAAVILVPTIGSTLAGSIAVQLAAEYTGLSTLIQVRVGLFVALKKLKFVLFPFLTSRLVS